MITVLLLARLRDECGTDSIKVDVAALTINTVAALREHLIERGMTVLNDGCIRCAVNQTFCPDSQSIQAGDEVAFMPPVTGG